MCYYLNPLTRPYDIQFLRFFRMAIKFLLITFFFSLVVFKPVHDAFPDKVPDKSKHNSTMTFESLYADFSVNKDKDKDKSGYPELANDYLWMYLIFSYFFTGLALYLISRETVGIIGVRQSYLGSQSTITDRTIRLSGIPLSLRSEEKIKDFIEELEIGKVESVTLCRKWLELDQAMDNRTSILRKLEEAWTVYLGQRNQKRGRFPPVSSVFRRRNDTTNEEDEETGHLLGEESNGEIELPTQPRPKATIRYGFLKFRSRYVDAIDYYEEKLRLADENVLELRKKTFEPTPIAFVTLDSVAACQMATQAVLDPSPKHLIASVSPAPSDVVWRNTYLSRSSRMARGWMITIVITMLSVFWSLVLVPIAGTLNIETIRKFFPNLAAALEFHPIFQSLVVTQLPTLVSTLLFIAVPYLYDWLANRQGMTSQGEIELSVISKNFFFVFFNYFIIFTILGTASNFYSFLQKFRDNLKDFTKVAYTLAKLLQGFQPFYTNLILLQGLGLFPLRLLEFGSVFLYPIYKMGAKTPRDYAELVQPPEFNYGFYLPQVMLIFLICIVYSILRESWKLILAGLLYFIIGGFVYKYQLLYAMDHRQHSTGRAWVMICNRIIIGLIIFQIATAGQLALELAYARSLATIPLVLVTIWYFSYYGRHYSPLMKHISLRSIERQAPSALIDPAEADPDGWGEQAQLRYESETHVDETVDESRERGMRFVNPSLVTE